jgi:DNA adenine methylase
MTEADHEALAEALYACAGMVVLSGRPSGLYDQLYGNWRRVDRKALTDSGQMGTETLWLNSAAAAAQRQQVLFGGVGA